MNVVKKKITRKHWTNEEDMLLSELVQVMTIDEIAEELDRTESSIRKRLDVLSIPVPKNRYILFIEDMYIREGTSEEIARTMDWKQNTVYQYLVRTRDNPERHNIHIYKV